MDILKDLEAIKADYKAATDLLETSKADIEAKDLEIKGYAESVATHAKAISDKDSEIARLTKEVSDLQAKEKTAHAKAIELNAAHGIQAPKVDAKSEAALTKEDALATYSDLLGKSPREAARFYKANQKLITSR